MDLQRKTLGQLMANALGFGKRADVSADADGSDAADESADDEDEDSEESDDEQADDAADVTEEKAEKKAAAPKAKSKSAGTVTLALAEYNALKADADQAKTLNAANATLKTKASAWDAHQKAIGGAAPKADTTNDAPGTEENAEEKEHNRLATRYKGMIPE